MMGRFVTIAILLCGYCSMSAYAATTVAPGPPRCQDDAGVLLPSATVCTDDIGSCASIFTPAATPGGTSRPALCDNDDLQTVAAQCARTCGICCEKPEYDCQDTPNAPINCTVNRRYCTNANWTEVMTRYCPQTCGLCNSGTGCRDQISGCSSMAGLCENVNFYQYMTDNCARTCGLCTSTTNSPSTCSDVATNCATNAGLCSNSVYYDLMTQKCPKTCGRCGASSGGSGSGSCTNTNSNCATWVANGFCTNSFYTAAQRRQYCGLACGLC